MVRLRQREPALLAGRFKPQRSQGDVLFFERRLDRRKLRIAVNIGDKDADLHLRREFTVLLSTYLDRKEVVHPPLRLRASEGVILRGP